MLSTLEKRSREGFEGKGFIGMEFGFGRGGFSPLFVNLPSKRITLGHGFWLSFDMATLLNVTYSAFYYISLQRAFCFRGLSRMKLRSIEVIVCFLLYIVPFMNL
jgi:hypothetical protein